jgi:NitT/TauT family transport system ATP-binding protein
MGHRVVSVRGVGRRFGKTEALTPVTLDVLAGQFVTLLGPSGCGKSTLLSLIAGLDTPSEGTLQTEGTPGVVFQEAALFPWRTVRDNVAFGLQMRGLDRNTRRMKAEEALKQVHLSRFADAFPHELSGGMRQRASIARALVLDPALLLMDEPFGALDAQTRALLQEELLTLWQRTQKTVIFVTHSLDEALLLSDRIVLLSARPGRVIADITVDAPRPRDIGRDPALAGLRQRLATLLAAEVASVAAAEYDDQPPPSPRRMVDEEAGSGI